LALFPIACYLTFDTIITYDRRRYIAHNLRMSPQMARLALERHASAFWPSASRLLADRDLRTSPSARTASAYLGASYDRRRLCAHNPRIFPSPLHGCIRHSRLRH
jgi:hypothetical protein